MKTRLLALSVVFALVACGGDGGSNSAPNPPPAPAPSPAACSSSPVITSATPYLGVLPTGQVGQWSFDTAGHGITYSVAQNSGSATLTQVAATCSYTGDMTGSLPTSFLSNGLAVSAANVGGVSYPALLVASPESSLANIAGTYNVLRYTTEKTNVTTVTTDYMTFNVDSAGNWRACPNAAYSATCSGLAGTLATDSNGGFDINLGGQAVGRLLSKVSGDSKVFIVALNNTADSSDLITGMWVGMVNTAFTVDAYDGSYVTESTDPASNVITIAGLTGKPVTARHLQR